MDTPQELLEQARRLYEEGKFEQSEAAFRTLSTIPLHAAEGLYGLGLIRMSLRDSAQAAALFQDALRADPRHGNALFQLGVLAEERGLTEEANACFLRALLVHPGHAGAKRKLAGLFAPAPGAGGRGDRDPCVPSRPQACELPPEPVLPAPPQASSSPESGDACREPFGVYAYLRKDPTPTSRQTLALMEALRADVRPTLGAYLGRFLLVGCVLPAVVAAAFFLVAHLEHGSKGSPHPGTGPKPPGLGGGGLILPGHLGLPIEIKFPWTNGGPLDPGNSAGNVVAAGAAYLLPSLFVLIGVLRRRITIQRGRLQLREGVLFRRLRNVELWRVSDIELHKTLLNQLTGDGTLIFHLHHGPALKVRGLARGRRLEDTYQKLLNLVFLLRSNPLVKGIIN